MRNMKNGSRLEKLTMKGFKSFSKQTSLIFSPGITAIVGPNGSGKSNIIDAISFVMGSLSFSSLRAKSAENLLYFGKTKKAREAEVDLTIRADSPIAEDGVIRLNRKLLSDGTSIYRINGKRSTRLATLDALASIHIFPDSHNVVHQGEITKFINMTPRERRELIEVVAGIELYETKKRKAMTDLENVEATAEKVEAVHSERMRIFNRLKEEQEKVRRFNELKQLEERARFGLLLKKIERLKEDARRLLEEKNLKKQEIERINEELGKKAEELSELNTALEKQGMREKVETMTRLEGLKMELNKLKSEKEEEAKGIEKVKNRLESIRAQVDGLRRRKSDIVQELKEKRKRLGEVQEELRKLKKLKDELVAKLSEARQNYEKRKREYGRLKEKKEKLVLRSKEVQLEKRSAEGILENLSNKLKREEERKLKLEAARKRAIEERKVLEREAEEIRSRLGAVEKSIEKLREKERAIIHSSSLPAGVRELKEKGFRVLGEVVEDPTGLMPFALSVVVPESEEPELERGWAFLLPENFDTKKLGELSRLGRPLGRITPYEFKGEKERGRELKEIEQKLKALEGEASALRKRKVEIEAVLSRKLDPHEMKSVLDSINSLKKEISRRKREISALDRELGELDSQISKIGELKEPELEEKSRIDELTSDLLKLESEAMRLSSEIKAGENTLKNLVEPDIKSYEKLCRELLEEIKLRKGRIEELDRKKAELQGRLEGLEAKVSEIDRHLKTGLGRKSELEELIKQSQTRLYQLKADITVIDERLKDIRAKVGSLEASKPGGIEPVENPEAVLREVTEELEKLGTLNFRATEEFEEISRMVKDISDRLEKLREERNAILKMMEEIEEQKRQVFLDTFKKINDNFSRIFSEVMDGTSRLELDSEDPFESGVHIKTNVRGRDLPTESLSGGQKTLAAIALIFAIQEVKPSPFYIFDEVDAALDKDNSEKLAAMLKEMSKTTQIVTITHNDTVVRESDQIVGVYMKGGYSRLLSLPKEKVLEEADSWIGRKEEPQGSPPSHQ